ncbi:MAG: MFS transporter, partial [Dehalococcoidia bacterium]|nr:MFS transporter [Dehalococcoidia bacterium]
MRTFGTWRIHYGWVIVAIASVMGTITSPVRFATSIVVPYLRDPGRGFGWSYGAITFAFTLQWLTLALVAPVIGWLADRYGGRWAMLLGAILFIAGMSLTGTMTHLWEFYLFFGVMLGVATTVFTVVTVSGITLWFRTHLGVAIGTLWFFRGIGAILLSLLITLVLDRFGLKWTFWLPGLVGGAILLLLIWPFYNEPAEIGLRPLGAPGDEPIRRLQGDTAKIRSRVFLQQARRTGAFWNLIGIHFWGCVGHSSIIVLLVAMAVDQGLSAEKAAGVYINFTIGSLISRLLVPVMGDRMG